MHGRHPFTSPSPIEGMAAKIEPKRLQDALILVVDDVKLNLKMLMGNLQARGYTNLAHAHNGVEALELSQRLRPDLVILDLMMPDMDGFAYCERIRKDTSFANMPIIVQTALDEMEHKLNAFKAGASDYITKPVDGRELEARVQVHLTSKLLMEDLSRYNAQIMLEMEAAKAMQNRLMPGEHQVKMCERVYDLRIGSYFEPSFMLGGDHWGMRPICDDKLAIYMYDFSGHGVSAAMNIFRMHTIMREFNHTSGEPGHFLSTLNRQLHPLLERHEFATMFYGIIDIEANCLLYASAGVPAPILCAQPEPVPLPLAGRGFPLGVIPNATYDTQYTAFLPGDMLVFFSDCLTETRNKQGAFLSDRALLGVLELAMQSDSPEQAAISGLRRLLKAHSAAPLIDDMTINAYYRRPRDV